MTPVPAFVEPDRSTTLSRTLLWTAFVVVLIGLALFLAVPLKASRGSRKMWAKDDAVNFSAAVHQYDLEYSAAPVGNAREVMSALRGANRRKIVFFDAAERSFNAQGEFIDPWGTPYRFDLSKPDAPRVWSCGPNRLDEAGAADSDDIASWR